MEYVSRKETLKSLKIHYQTLYRMKERGEIETITIGKRTLYNLDKYLREKSIMKKEKRKVCYCRVSSAKQKEDLERQINYMKQKYPEYEIIKDIGSGLNFGRKGLLEILEGGINGEIEEIIIAYKDRLARIGYEIIEWIIKKYSKGKIIIINKKEEETPKEEMTKDVLSILNVYVAKVNGLRKYKEKIRNDINKG
jgi:putative resolvase